MLRATSETPLLRGVLLSLLQLHRRPGHSVLRTSPLVLCQTLINDFESLIDFLFPVLRFPTVTFTSSSHGVAPSVCISTCILQCSFKADYNAQFGFTGFVFFSLVSVLLRVLLICDTANMTTSEACHAQLFPHPYMSP